MKCIKRLLKIFNYFLFCSVFVIISSTSVLASDWEQYIIPESTLEFYNTNGITAYNPSSNYSANCLPGENLNYNGGIVLDESQLQQIITLQPIYEEAASMYGFDWRILATLHYMERSNSLESPSNGQGVYQLYSYTKEHGKFPSSGTLSTDEFREQTILAAQLIHDQYGAGLDLSTSDGVKTMFFKYNGASSFYKQRALQLGFDQAGADRGEGSPYVMNKYDSLRDPELNPAWRGAYKSDGVWDSTYVYTRYGAYPVYVALGGVDDAGICYPSTGGGILIEGGMTLEQANAYMETYRQLEDTYSATNYGSLANANSALNTEFGMLNFKNATMSIIHNCTSFTKYFIKESTISGNIYKEALGDGGQVVGNLLSKYPQYFEDGGTTPRPYAIFSTSNGSTTCGDQLCGHTGVVLGIDVARNKIIIGEAAYRKPNFLINSTTGKGEAHEYDLSKFTSGNYKFAYPKNLIFGDSDNDNIIADDNIAVSTSNDNLNVTIPGLSGSYKIGWVSDTHVAADADKNTDAYKNLNVSGRFGDNTESNWNNIINRLNSGGYDAVIFGGDLMDYYSENNYNVIKNGLNQLKMPWFYIYGSGDHDKNNDPTGHIHINDDLFSSGSYNANDMITLGGELTLIGLNGSSRASDIDIAGVESKIRSTSNPVILATHVPFDSKDGSIKTQVAASHNNVNYLWTNGSYNNNWEISNISNFVNTFLYSNSNVKLVLAGHVHTLSYTGKLNGEDGAMEHIFKAGYTGNIGTINVKGN